MPPPSLTDFNISEGTHEFTVSGTVNGGSFIRSADGVDSPAITITSTGDTTFSGSTIVSNGRPDYMKGIEIGIGKNIGLYDFSDPDNIHIWTEDEVDAIFEQGYEAVKEAFSTADKYVPPETLTAEEVKAAIRANDKMVAADNVQALTFNTDGHALTFKGANITIDSLGITTIDTMKYGEPAAEGEEAPVIGGARLTFDNSNVVFTGGGADNIINAAGIDFKSGTFQAIGSDENGIFADKYDNRGREDRNDWLTGENLTFTTTDGINVGKTGTAGPDILFRDSMVLIWGDGDFNIESGTINIDGVYSAAHIADYRSSGSLNFKNGTLNISSSDRINRVWRQASSMLMSWRPMKFTGGTVNLVNSQLYGSTANGNITIDGDVVVNMVGDSAISTSTKADLFVKGGTIHLGERAFLGAIQDDSYDYSDYPTHQRNIEISGGNMTFDVVAPEEGTVLDVGKNIGGIYSTEAGSTITVSGGEFNFNTGLLKAGETYTADDFISVMDDLGTLNITEYTKDNLFYTANISNTGALTLEVKDSTAAVAAITGNSYLAKNAAAFGTLAATATGVAAARIAEIWQMTEDATAAEMAQASADLRDVTNPGSAAGMFGMKNSADLIGAEVFSQVSLATGAYDDTTGKRIWGTAVGDWGRVNGNSDFDIDTAGVVFGADHTFDQTVRAGFAFGALHTSSDGEGAKYTGDSYWIGMYGSWKLPMNFPLVLDADALYGWTDGDVDTSLFGNSGSADVDGDVIRVSAHASMPFELSVASVVPYIGLEWTRVSQDGYTDGSLGRSVDSLDEDALTMPVGVKFVKTIENGSASFKGTMDIAYARDLTDFDPRVTTAYGAAAFDSESADIGEDAFRFGLGVDCRIGQSWTVGAKYKLEVRDNYTDNVVKGQISYLW